MKILATKVQFVNSQYIRLTALVFVLLLCATAPRYARAAEIADLVIQNFHIIEAGASADTETETASLKVTDNKLVLVSKDAIPTDDDAKTYDAAGGYLLGNLVVGEVPNFIILTRNPAVHMDVLLDTKPHISFAVDKGELARNSLVQTHETPGGDPVRPARARWLAYQSPPIALPTSYEAGRKWNSWKSRWVNGLFISAGVLDREFWEQDQGSIDQFGSLSPEFDSGTIRGFRFAALGTINFDKPWIWTIGGATTAFDRGFDTEQSDSFTFLDVRLDVPLGKKSRISVGKQKEPINMERLMPLIELPAQERTAAADAMLPARNWGAVISGNALNDRMSWGVGIFNDWFTGGRGSSENTTQTVGRVTWLPYLSENESGLVHLGLGVRYDDGTEGFQYRSRPETGNAPAFVDTEAFAGNSSTLYNYELGVRSGPYWLLAEYTDNHVDAPDLGNPRFTGYNISGTWILSGEMRRYEKSSGLFRSAPIAQNVHQGGKGRWELGFRYSSVDLTDGGIDGGDMDIATFNVFWWPTLNWNVGFSVKRIWTDRFGVTGQTDSAVTRVTVILR